MRPSTPPSPIIIPHHMQSIATPPRLHHQNTSPPRIRSPPPPSPPPQRIHPSSSSSSPPMPRIRSPTPPASGIPVPQASQIPRSLFSTRSSNSLIPTSVGGAGPSKGMHGYGMSFSGGFSPSVGGARPRVNPFTDRGSDEKPTRRPSRQTSFSTVQEHYTEGQ